MENTVFVFHIGRSGSRVLGKLLDQHPHLQWDGEALHTPQVEAFRTTLDDPASYDTFDHLTALSERRENPWLGVEVKFYHLRKRELALEAFVERIATMGCERFVVLRRKNVLRKIVSSMVAKENREYHRDATKKPKLTQIEIDPAKVEIDAESKPLIDYLDDYRASFAALDSLLADKATLSLSYEDDICEDPRRASGRVCEHIGLTPHEPEIPFGRTNPFPLPEIVTNLEIVRAALADTPHAWMAE